MYMYTYDTYLNHYRYIYTLLVIYMYTYDTYLNHYSFTHKFLREIRHALLA